MKVAEVPWAIHSIEHTVPMEMDFRTPQGDIRLIWELPLMAKKKIHPKKYR